MGMVDDLLEGHRAPDKGYVLDEETWLYPERGRKLLRHTGFTEVSVKIERFTGRFADAEQALRWSLAWPSRAVRLARLHPTDRQALVAEAHRAIAETDLNWSFVFNIYIATKAAGP